MIRLELNKTNIFAIGIILLFIGSMFVGVVYRPDDTSNASVNTDDKNLNLELYTANIDANIISKFPKFIISAQTNEYDLSVIDTDFKKIKGVKEVVSNFNNVDINNIILISSITYDSKYKDSISEALYATDYFESVDIYEYALLKVNQNIEFINKEDQNKVLTYYLPTQKYEGIINNSSLVGDHLQVNAQALFNKDDLYRLTLIEMQNLSNSPKFFTVKKNYPIKSWNKNIIINLKTDFDNILDPNDILDYNLSTTSNVSGNLTCDLTDVNVISDFNAEINSIKDQNESYILDFVLDENKSQGIITFSNDLTFDQYTFFKDLLKTNYSLDNSKFITNLSKSLVLNIFEEDIDVNHTKNLLEANGFECEDIFKSANVDIRDTNLNNILYFYDKNISEVQLRYPKDKDVNALDFDVSFYATRNNILFLMLTESINDTNTILEE